MRRSLVAACALVALAVPSGSMAARYAVGIQPGAALSEVALVLAGRPGTDVTRTDSGLRVVYVDAPGPPDADSLQGVEFVERVDRPRRQLAFSPNDPLFFRQWYLSQIRAFDYWPQLPTLAGPLVAVLDSGVDAGHPDFKNRIAAGKSFIGGSPYEDRRGHGTFVAGLLAAATGNATGIAGIAFSSQLLVGKIAGADGTIQLDDEADAIRWAANSGARVINLSLAGVRYPFHTRQDTYSDLEARAVAYARRKGALVVAAVGNGDQAPRMPWYFAGYPAALPHVLGVSAITRDGSVPAFSNRDEIYNDLTAPGDEIYSTIPRSLATRPGCGGAPYSDCGASEYRNAQGTSFAAPQAAAAAALVWSVRPRLAPNQVATILERSTQDMAPGTGCRACSVGRDRFTGWGRLDVAAAVGNALAGDFPRADRYEDNDDAGGRAWKLKWRRGTLTATLDFWDDPSDVYRIRLKRGQRFSAHLRGPAAADVNLVLWKPGTKTVQGIGNKRQVASQSVGGRPSKRIARYRAPARGFYYLEARMWRSGAGVYSLSIAKR